MYKGSLQGLQELQAPEALGYPNALELQLLLWLQGFQEGSRGDKTLSGSKCLEGFRVLRGIRGYRGLRVGSLEKPNGLLGSYRLSSIGLLGFYRLLEPQ